MAHVLFTHACLSKTLHQQGRRARLLFHEAFAAIESDKLGMQCSAVKGKGSRAEEEAGSGKTGGGSRAPRAPSTSSTWLSDEGEVGVRPRLGYDRRGALERVSK
jgi:hypothetical protein